MNQIKQKIKEIGLSQREISKRLGKNASYWALCVALVAVLILWVLK